MKNLFIFVDFFNVFCNVFQYVMELVVCIGVEQVKLVYVFFLELSGEVDFILLVNVLMEICYKLLNDFFEELISESLGGLFVDV